MGSILSRGKNIFSPLIDVKTGSVAHPASYPMATVSSFTLMLFKEELAVYCENHTEHNTLRGQNVEF
jgi:hypothetical protein